MDKNKLKLLAFDLDGTLTQHKTQLGEQNRDALLALSKKYKLLMVGAGDAERIFNQLGGLPIDIIGNYGMQYAEYDKDTEKISIKENHTVCCDRESVEKRTAILREKFGFTEYKGESVEFHDSGCVTIALLGTKANIEDKLRFDPDRSRRRSFYNEVVSLFPDFNVFVGGSSSFDMSPAPFEKHYALKKYCDEHSLSCDEVLYFGDDYGMGGNDEPIYKSEFNFCKIDDYRLFAQTVKPLL